MGTAASKAEGNAEKAEEKPTVLYKSARLAVAADRIHAAAILTRAFADDPVMDWFLRDDEWRPKHSCDFFLQAVNQSMNFNTAIVSTVGDNLSGVSCWYPPGKKFDPNFFFLDFVGWSYQKVQRLQAYVHATDAVHPKEPHYYLFAIGVDPLAQGKGCAGDMMRGFLAKADAEGVPCYLESSNPKNTAMYEHLGFVNKGRIEMGEGAPQLLGMWRDVPAKATN
jgi:ribosomal protein S18 acetylase RimI-like enzyme